MGRGYRNLRKRPVRQWITLTEAALLLDVGQEQMMALVYSTERRIRPRVAVGKSGQRVEYDLADLEKLVLEDAERRLQ